ncbi:hypothetical protein JCM16303_006234 [Sporobolomyces ruberrimus]
MAAEYDTKAVLLDWMKEGENKHCSECRLPSPQWCSLSYGTTLCLSCSGTHRSLGVHLSFVRSLTMDKWTQPQIKRMLEGGNQKAREFFEANGEKWKNDNMNEKYNSHTASMYRDKLLADAEGRPWIPSDTPTADTSSLRKPRTNQSTSLSSSSTAASSRGQSTAANSIEDSRKEQNENYFARMGNANAQRSADLPPSQGGKYAGFGSQPQGQSSGGGGGNGGVGALSSRALPGLDDLRDDPVRALGKGWGFLGAALGAVSKTVNDSVIQPGIERAHDPALQSQFSSFLSTATSSLSSVAKTGGQVLSTGLESSSQFLKRDLGVDVGDLGAHYLDKATGRGAGEGYGRVGEEWAPNAASRHEPGEGDFFDDQLGGSGGGSRGRSSGYGTPTINGATTVAGGSGLGRAGGFKDDDGFEDMPRTQPVKSISPPPPPPPQVEGDWSSFAPKAAAARAAQAGKQPETNKKDDGWGDFDDF